MSRHRKLTLILAPATLIVGCAVGPTYKQPPAETPESFVSQEVLRMLNEGDRADMPLKWWEGFEDPLLNELIEAALLYNIDIGIAAARLREAEALLNQAEAGNRPVLDAGADGSLQQERRLDGVQPRRTNTRSLVGALGLVIPIDIFGRTARRVESATANIEALEADLRQRALTVSSEVAAEYLSLRGNQKQLELLSESIELQEKTLSIVRTRFETGLAPELDVRRAETSVEQLNADVPPLEEALLNSRNRLAVLTARFPGYYEKDLLQAQEAASYRAKIPDAIPLEVVRRRPDVQRAEARMKEAIAEIGIAEAELYPSFEIVGQLTIGTSVSSGAQAVETLVGAIGAGVNQVLLDGGVRRAEIRIANAQAEVALLEYRQVLLAACEEVESALASLESSYRTQSALERAVTASSRSFAQAETLYQQGLISFLDVVDAQRVLANAEQQLASERTRFATQIAVLFRTLGTETKLREREPVTLPMDSRGKPFDPR